MWRMKETWQYKKYDTWMYKNTYEYLYDYVGVNKEN